MTQNKRTRKAVILVAQEAVEGVLEAFNPATDALNVENLSYQASTEVEQTDELTDSLDAGEEIPLGEKVTITFDTILRGTTVAGVAPDWGVLMGICGQAETLQAAVGPEALAAGGSTTIAVLGVSASAVDDAYLGMPILFTGAVVGTSTIIDYDGASKTATLADTMSGALIATTTYEIPDQVRYLPASASIPSASFAVYKDGIKFVASGGRGNFVQSVNSGKLGRLRFTIQAIAESETEEANPVPTLDARLQPPIWAARDGGVCKLNRFQSAVESLELDTGNELVSPENPNATEGFDPAQIVGRRTILSINPKPHVKADIDLRALKQAGTKISFVARAGSVAGNRWSVVSPALKVLEQNPTDTPLMRKQLRARATGPDQGSALSIF